MHHWSSFVSRSMLRARRPMRRGFRSRLMAGFAAAFGVILPLSGLAGCGQIQVTTVSGAPEGPNIAIGVAADEPSVGAWHDGTYQGFDITIAKYVAAKLGYANKQIVFKQVRPENRRSMLDNGQVDMVVASWPITDGSSAIVDFAGPYLTTSVGLLVRSDERGRFTNDAGSVGDVGDGTVCAVKGDETVGIFRGNHPQARIQERSSYAQCVTAVQVGSADAIASDMAVLSGLQAANGPQYMDVIADKGEVSYGIAVSQGTSQLAQKIAEALEDMVEDGSWTAAKDTFTSQTKLTVSLNGDPKAIVSDAE